MSRVELIFVCHQPAEISHEIPECSFYTEYVAINEVFREFVR